MSEVDLNFIAAQCERIIREIEVLRDDATVANAILTRIDHTIRALTDEVRAMNTESST